MIDETRKEFEILRRESCDVNNLKDLEALSQKVIENLKAVNLLRDEGNARLKSSPIHSNKIEHKKFSHEDLNKFTSQFVTNVGSGGFSDIYKGHLDDDTQVAVKVLKTSVAIDIFMAELQTMVIASHPNIVTLYGFCFDYDMKALVYEFVKNGSLDKILFDNHLSLEWGELYEIALGTAKGLAYLHDGCGKQIIHRDMKPANVLVGKNLSAKITDFGLAKLISTDADYYTITNQNKGTDGYIAPEFGFLASKITKKCDVYSFGMTLFDVLMRKRHNHGRCEDWFPVQVWTKFKTGKLDELIESFGIPETHKGKAKILLMVAFWCSQYIVERRPSMSTVVDFLEKEISVNTPPDPFQFYPEASTVVHESMAISNPTPVAAANVSINAVDEEESKTSSEFEKLPSELGTTRQQPFSLSDLERFRSNFSEKIGSTSKLAISNSSEQLQHEESKTSSEIEKLLTELGTAKPQPFSLSDLERFTSNFSEKIGSGGYGVVYKGQFLDGMEVAVKVLHDMEVFDKTFMDAVMTLEMVNHPNIVKLHGYCFDGKMKALVYEYIGNGSLDTILYRNHSPDIEWEQLYEIAIETAMGLSVLHAAGIIHHDIKASKILLDSNLSPKIRSYELKGLIIMKGDVTRIPESCYSSPEMRRRSRWGSTSKSDDEVTSESDDEDTSKSDDEVTSESDVYSFGMLLFEVLGRRNISNQEFPRHVWKMFKKGLLGQVREDCGISKKDRQKAFTLSKVALWCAQDNPSQRPSMSSVVKMLEMEIPVMDPQKRPSMSSVVKMLEMEIPVMDPPNPASWKEFQCSLPLSPNLLRDDVYEYIEKGSLDIILYRNHLRLEWEQLYEIATETARGLSVLHAVGIIHNDIKPSNILLNSNLSPKIRSSGFGGHFIMKKNDDSTRIAGSYGYSAPETWIPTSKVTSKSDVYSFGMLLFEVLGGRSIINHRGQEWFPAHVWKMFDKGLLGKVGEDCGINKQDRGKAFNLSKVALWCAQFDPQKRPSMSCVVEMLEMKKPVTDPPNPFPYAQLSSSSSSPEVSPRFKASPSIELRFHEERSLVEKSQSGGDWDNYMELYSRLDSFEENCPPGGENSVVLYTTAGWHWQDRLTECNYICSILKSHKIKIIERDISANWDYWVELRKLLDRTEVPALFVRGRFIGGVNEVKRLEEEDKLKLLLYGIPDERLWMRLVQKMSRKWLDFKKIWRRRSGV